MDIYSNSDILRGLIYKNVHRYGIILAFQVKFLGAVLSFTNFG